MRFWDASAVVPLLVEQPASPAVDARLASDPGMIVWWGTAVECASALARLLHEGALGERDLGAADAVLGSLGSGWYEVQPSVGLRDRAMRLLRVHDLRAADALQLSAALEWSETAEGELVTFDRRLAAAARREGFIVPDLAV